jgi:hypothetical protein
VITPDARQPHMAIVAFRLLLALGGAATSVAAALAHGHHDGRARPLVRTPTGAGDALPGRKGESPALSRGALTIPWQWPIFRRGLLPQYRRR